MLVSKVNAGFGFLPVKHCAKTQIPMPTFFMCAKSLKGCGKSSGQSAES